MSETEQTTSAVETASESTESTESATALGGQEASTASDTPHWSDSLSDENKESGFIKEFMDKDINEFAKSARHANSMVGADKLVMINDKSSDEDKAAFYTKLGRPEDSAGYEIPDKFKEEGSGLDENSVSAFRDKAYEQGLNSKQFAELVHFQADLSSKAAEAQSASLEARNSEWDSSLKTDFGDAYDQNIGLAKAALEEFAGPELVEAINQLDIGNNPAMVKFCCNVGKALNSDSIHGDGMSASFKASPSELKTQLEAFEQENVDALLNKAHPDSRRLNAERKEMQAIIFG